MRIGVMSDTHMREPDRLLDFILDEVFADMDMILHAGDIVAAAVLEYMELRGVTAVCGNMCDYDVAKLVPQRRLLEVAGKRIALIHGWGSRDGLERRLIDAFAEPFPDVIVYGHSHIPFWGRVQGVSMFNPGAAGRRGGGSVGILEILDDTVRGEFVSL
jgi:putative phosphoesterase